MVCCAQPGIQSRSGKYLRFREAYHLKHFLDQYLYYTRKKGYEEPDPIQDSVPNENEARGMLLALTSR